MLPLTEPEQVPASVVAAEAVPAERKALPVTKAARAVMVKNFRTSTVLRGVIKAPSSRTPGSTTRIRERYSAVGSIRSGHSAEPPRPHEARADSGECQHRDQQRQVRPVREPVGCGRWRFRLSCRLEAAVPRP